MAFTFTVRFMLCVALACPLAAAADIGARSGDGVVVVEVNGTRLTLADLEQKSGAALFQARTSYYEAERKAIEGLIDNYLLEKQAAKEGVNVAELLEKHVNAAIAKDPSEETLRVYYEGVDTADPYEAVRGKIIGALRQRRTAKAKTAYMQSLRAQSSVVLRLAPPRAQISMKDVPIRGAASPRVTVVEFADFECPVCQQVQPVVDKLAAEFKGQVAFAYKDFPLTMHADAQKAAEAAHCAGAQGKYWEYHDTMFAAKALAPLALKGYARDLKLDTSAFDACLDNGQMTGLVKAQLDEAMAFGFPGTPTFLVNGRFVSGNMTYDKLRAVITEELSAAASQATGVDSAASKSLPVQTRIP